jgi:alginate O-acetyltransferase complex protein AlgI
MLFNSYAFIFVFLPLALLGFHLIGARSHQRLAIAWLVGMSLVFYSWWNPAYLALLLLSILGNYAFGLALTRHKKKLTLIAGISANIFVLGFFKYTNFFLNNLSTALSVDYQIAPLILPLAISFFTFQQIAYLVDAYQGKAHEYGFLNYCLFVSFFPQLIAGPIVHHKELLPQFSSATLYRLKSLNLAVGLTIFSIGLFKKVVIADEMAIYANPIFDAALTGQTIGFIDGWGAAFAYTFQLYFDFSGYSDMAIGLARMFGISLPVNFFSPYKASNIIEFWRRWHMTLSRFLRDYIYIPIGGNTRRVTSILFTMLLGGLWHGAGWTFILWGALHGLYLLINHAWQTYNPSQPSCRICWSGRFLTFILITLGWVLFRAQSWDVFIAMLLGMSGMNGYGLPINTPDINWKSVYGILVGLTFIVWTMPNTSQLMSRYQPTLKDDLLPTTPIWKPLDQKWLYNSTGAYITAVISIVGFSMLSRVSEFLYYQF